MSKITSERLLELLREAADGPNNPWPSRFSPLPLDFENMIDFDKLADLINKEMADQDRVAPREPSPEERARLEELFAMPNPLARIRQIDAAEEGFRRRVSLEFHAGGGGARIEHQVIGDKVVWNVVLTCGAMIRDLHARKASFTGDATRVIFEYDAEIEDEKR